MNSHLLSTNDVEHIHFFQIGDCVVVILVNRLILLWGLTEHAFHLCSFVDSYSMKLSYLGANSVASIVACGFVFCLNGRTVIILCSSSTLKMPYSCSRSCTLGEINFVYI